jgi:hypothetical protein
MLVLEVLPDSSVNVFDWTEFIKADAHSQYDKIAIRFLNSELSESQLATFQAIITSNFASKSFATLEQSSSSFVADVYHQLDLLPAAVSTASAFAASANLQLLSENSLSLEFTVKFSKLPPHVLSMLRSNDISSAPQSSRSAIFQSQCIQRPELSPLWISDDSASVCMLCSAAFTLTFRRHHCRNCGFVICFDCASFAHALPHASPAYQKALQKVCSSCHHLLSLRKRGINADAVLDYANKAVRPEHVLCFQQLKHNLTECGKQGIRVSQPLLEHLRLLEGSVAVVSFMEEPSQFQVLRLFIVLPLHSESVVAITSPLTLPLSRTTPLQFKLLCALDQIEGMELEPISVLQGQHIVSVCLRFVPSMSRSPIRLMVHAPTALVPASFGSNRPDTRNQLNQGFQQLELELSTFFNSSTSHLQSSFDALRTSECREAIASQQIDLNSTSMLLQGCADPILFSRFVEMDACCAALPALQFSSVEELCEFSARECVDTVSCMLSFRHLQLKSQVLHFLHFFPVFR